MALMTVSLSFHGVMVADELPGTSRSPSLWPPLLPWHVICLIVQPQQQKRLPNAKKRNILKSPTAIIYFPLHSRRSVVSARSVRTSFLLWAISNCMHPILTTHANHSFYSNAFLLQSSCLLRSFIRQCRRWSACDVTSRDNNWLLSSS